MAGKRIKPFEIVENESEALRKNEAKDTTVAGQQSSKQLPFDVHARKESLDVVGVLPKDITVDPNLTEGHPGYQESGKSEINLRKSPSIRR